MSSTELLGDVERDTDIAMAEIADNEQVEQICYGMVSCKSSAIESWPFITN